MTEESRNVSSGAARSGLLTSHTAQISVAETALELDGWLAWNEEMWGLRPLRVRYGGTAPDQPRLEGVLYLTKRGTVRLPPRNPFLPFRFVPTATTRVERISRQWIDLCTEFADDLLTRGIAGTITLPPGLIDARPFQWIGLDVSLQYTYITELPLPAQRIGDAVRRKIKKAESEGIVVRQSDDWHGIVECLAATEQAKDFSHQTDAPALQRLHRLVGPETLRAFVTESPAGRRLGALLRLDLKGGTTLAWSEGTRREALPTGAVQIALREDIRDATACGAVAYDFVGANIPSVARAKSDWGAALVPYLTVSSLSVRGLVKHGLRTVRGIYQGYRRSSACITRRPD